MARIPESELERLKREVSLERLAAARGVKLERLKVRRAGADDWGWKSPTGPTGGNRE